MWQRLGNVRVWLAAVLLAVLYGAGTPAPAGAAELSFHIVDLGAGQLVEGLRRFFAGLVQRGGRDPSGGGRYTIRIVMPNAHKMDMLGDRSLMLGIAHDLERQVREARAAGYTDFTIEIVEDVDTLVAPGIGERLTGRGSYWSKTQQERAARFGRAAYEALGRVMDGLEAGGDRVWLEGFFGSNGTAVFARSVEAWRRYARRFARVTMVDGRAYAGEVRAVITTLGASRVRFVSTHGDAPAPPGSIGELRTVRGLLESYPELTVLELTPARLRDRVPLAGHIRALAHPDDEFEAVQLLPEGRALPLGRIRGRDLFPDWTGPDYRRLGDRLPPLGRDWNRGYAIFEGAVEIVEVWYEMPPIPPDAQVRIERERARRFAEGLKSAREIYERLHRLSDEHGPLAGNGGNAIWNILDLVEAVERDIEESRDRDFVVLRSHTLEQLARIGLQRKTREMAVGWLLRRGLIREGFARRVVGLPSEIADITAGLARIAGSGRPDPEGVTLVLDALNRMAWGAVGTTLAGPAGGAVAAEIGDAVAKTGRKLTFRAFLRAVVRDRGLDREMLANFHTLNRRRLASGLAPLSIQEFYGFDRDILDALDRRAIREANARYGLPESPPRPEPTLTIRRTRIERWSEVCRAGVCTRTPLPVAIPVPVPRPGSGYGVGGEARTVPPPAGGPAIDDVALSRPDRDPGGASATRALPDAGTGSGGVLRPRPGDLLPDLGDCRRRGCVPPPARHTLDPGGGQQPPPPADARRRQSSATAAGGGVKGVRIAPRPEYAGELPPDLTAGILAACDFSRGPVCDLTGKE